jgi:hypothetical protein
MNSDSEIDWKSRPPSLFLTLFTAEIRQEVVVLRALAATIENDPASDNVELVTYKEAGLEPSLKSAVNRMAALTDKILDMMNIYVEYADFLSQSGEQ